METRHTIAIILGIVIVVMTILVIYNREEFFKKEIHITYADGCVEIYINDNLTTPVCTEGRRMEEMRKQQQGDFIFPTNC